ncbi:MAG: hypothetical protein M1814_002443 [Vezdaea aestivalis]|nr:MAG: hypothetical protein M1814_002443 [Vezdaea aestivalis]
MAATQEHTNYHKEYNGAGTAQHTNGTNDLDRTETVRKPAFGGDFQPGRYAPSHRKFANPAPLGLSAFALTTFILSLLNLNTRNLLGMNSIVIGSAFAYGGLVQLLAGMWEMAVGNTFGATALSSYGGFWIAVAITLTGSFGVEEAYATPAEFEDAFGFFLMGWFIFTFILLMCTLRSTVAFFFLFFTLDLAFLMLGIGYLHRMPNGKPNPAILKAGGGFGLLSAFAAWYNAFAGLVDDSNNFFTIPVAHFPWSDKGRERRGKTSRENV